jgi:peptidoglycan/LPS O-acetylase OafA/YrhL
VILEAHPFPFPLPHTYTYIHTHYYLLSSSTRISNHPNDFFTVHSGPSAVFSNETLLFMVPRTKWRCFHSGLFTVLSFAALSPPVPLSSSLRSSPPRLLTFYPCIILVYCSFIVRPRWNKRGCRTFVLKSC